MKRTALFLLAVIAIFCDACAADLRTRNVFLIMTNGLRRQEVFTGAEGRREALIPFLTVGQIAATMTEFLGHDYRRAFSQAGEPIREVIGN